MKFTTVFSALAVAVTSVAAQNYTESGPFALVIDASNKTINGASLGACHEGAGIEALCLGDKLNSSNISPYTTYTWNTTEYTGGTGVLVWLLEGYNFNESEAMSLYYNPISNIAMPMFGFGEATYVGFDSCNKMNIQGYDDNVYPVNASKTTAFYRWYACETYFTGYTYQTLNWALGEYEPENPTCVPVNVTRVNV